MADTGPKFDVETTRTVTVELDERDVQRLEKLLECARIMLREGAGERLVELRSDLFSPLEIDKLRRELNTYFQALQHE